MRYSITSPLSSEGLLNHAVIFMKTGVKSFSINVGCKELYPSAHEAQLRTDPSPCCSLISASSPPQILPTLKGPTLQGRVQVLEKAGRLKLQPRICYLLTGGLGNLLCPAKPGFSPLQSVYVEGCYGNSRMQSVVMLHSGADFPSIPLLL